jgi:hypothetical protein
MSAARRGENPMSKKKRRDVLLSKWLKTLLGQGAPMELQDMDAMAMGDPGKTNAEIIAGHIVGEALKKERWAIELIADRTEGKPMQAVKQDDGDRSTEERIEDVTRAHLNDLARVALGVVSGAGDAERPAEPPDADEADPGDRPARPTRNKLDVPEDGDNDSEGT